MKSVLISLALLSAITINAQVTRVEELEEKYLNWQNKDMQADGLVGISLEKAYRDFLSAHPFKKTIIVAVIDSGVDINHEDLQGKVWINEDEVPNNGLDDDNNGYIDDVYGWNFIGAKDGQNIDYENFEYTRTVKLGVNNPQYSSAKKLYDAESEKRNKERENLQRFYKIYTSAKSIIKTATGIDVFDATDLDKVASSDKRVLAAKGFLKERYEMGLTDEGLDEIIQRNDDFHSYYLNLDFNPRDIVGDDPLDLDDRDYGNPDVIGPRANHGSSVAGLIAANRANGLGIDGIAENVKIMAIRSTPNGDERDKDVALAIMYAVENGADIINMSFGKDISPEKEFVDMAVKYAEKNGVLLIHSAGNSGKNIDLEASYPSGKYSDGSEATNWLSVGASDQKQDANIVAIFSNYGASQVDLFAPGVNIISLDSSSTYSMNDGTSLSGPVVAGVAALVLSVYPDITPQEMIDILMSSVYKFKKPKKVLSPSLEDEKRSKSKFTELSKSGGIVNAYNALIEAEKRSIN
jgi:subtilisin family serine protease